MRLKNAATWLALTLIAGSTAIGQGDDRLVGVWDSDEGFRTYELLFRSGGRYQLDTRSTDPIIDLSSTERGRYQVEGQTLILTPYDYLIKPDPRRYQFGWNGDSLSLTNVEYGQTQSFQFQPGSKAAVLAREQVNPSLVGVWRRHIAFYGEVECTFRPGGYYVVKQTPDDPQFATTYRRGRYEKAGNQVTFQPYSEAEELNEIDFFGNQLTLVQTGQFSAESATFEMVPGSEIDVRTKAAEAETLLARTNWQVGVWEIRNRNQSVDLTLRPDGCYTAELGTGPNKEIVRGTYTLDLNRIHLTPFAGQDLYAHSGGEFGNAERVRQLDYYDGELQFIDLGSVIQSVTVARRRPGSEESVADKLRQSQTERARDGWPVGVWQVNDGAGWMEFTLRPDGRYMVKAGTGGVLKEVERGRYRFSDNKLTLAPYPNLGDPRGFEMDFYDGAMLLIGDPYRMVVARKVPGSDVTVSAATTDPDALKGARGPLVGLWSLPLNSQYAAELVFRPDGQFRLTRCVKGALSPEYGLYSVDLNSRTLVLDSRLEERATAALDFYGNTVTLVSTNVGFPVTYVINPGQTDAALQASFAADALKAGLDAQWLKLVAVGPRNPEVGEIPSLPIDLQPGRVLEGATVFTAYRHYQRIIRGFVYNVPVDNSQEWHFLRNGRVLIRFIQNRAAPYSPVIVPEIIEVWGAYNITPSHGPQDIFHIYADNSLHIETDLGEQLELTLEDGRRHLFWGTDRALLDEWAAVQQPIACQPPANPDPSLSNTGISLRTTVPPDDLTDSLRFTLFRSVAGNLSIRGTSPSSATLLTEQATSFTLPIRWETLQTNAVSGGPFAFTIPASTKPQSYYRLRRQ